MDRRPFTLYWSSLDTYEKCPQSFLWGRGWGNIDVGGGPGRKKPVPVKKSEHHALMGDAIQGVLELFYNEKRWQYPAELKNWLDLEIEKQFKLALSQRFVDWRVANMTRVITSYSIHYTKLYEATPCSSSVGSDATGIGC